jgi:hypothetical protein
VDCRPFQIQGRPPGLARLGFFLLVRVCSGSIRAVPWTTEAMVQDSKLSGGHRAVHVMTEQNDRSPRKPRRSMSAMGTNLARRRHQTGTKTAPRDCERAIR